MAALALRGGSPARTAPFPSRPVFDDPEIQVDLTTGNLDPVAAEADMGDLADAMPKVWEHREELAHE